MHVRPAHLVSCWTAAILFPSLALCQQPTLHQQILQLVEQHSTHFSAISKTIWGYAELGYQEQKSSALLRSELEAAGFHVQSPVANEPTAFVASFGHGSPVIAILGEFDALPGLSQAATPDRSPWRRARQAMAVDITCWALGRRWRRSR